MSECKLAHTWNWISSSKPILRKRLRYKNIGLYVLQSLSNKQNSFGQNCWPWGSIGKWDFESSSEDVTWTHLATPKSREITLCIRIDTYSLICLFIIFIYCNISKNNRKRAPCMLLPQSVKFQKGFLQASFTLNRKSYTWKFF